MSWHGRTGPGAGGPGRRGYHHGNLREALVAAALALIAEKGPAGLTFAEAARVAGVSGAAPYRHFRDRDALLADVAKQGFEAFTAALTSAWSNGQPNVAEAFERVGAAYLAFARREPAYFSAMFESGLSYANFPDLRAESERAFAVLRQACEAIIATLPPERRPPALMMALHIWSLSHGIATLFGRADQGRRPIPMSPEDLLQAAVLIYMGGLGLR